MSCKSDEDFYFLGKSLDNSFFFAQNKWTESWQEMGDSTSGTWYEKSPAAVISLPNFDNCC